MVPGISRLIVGTSGSPGSLRALRYADALIAVWGEIPRDPMVEPHLERGPAGWVLVSLARELRHGHLAWILRHRPLTAEQVLGEQPSPPN